jgi:ligand-binding sensor domain-containing protein
MRWRLLGVLALAGCAAGMPGPAGAPLVSGSFRAEDRVVLGDFSDVRAVASSFDRVYVAYPSAIAIWEPLRRRWDVPRAAPDINALARVQFAIIDPLDQSLWLAGDDGVVHFEPLTDRWERVPAPGRITALAVDPNAAGDGVWMRSGATWFRIPRVGTPMPASPPANLRLAPTVEDAYRDIPSLRTFGPSMSLGPGLIPGRITAAAPNPDGSGWFIGTDRAGLLVVDRVGARAEQLTVGLPGEMVGAAIAVPGGVWVATDDDSRGNPAALAFVPEALTGTVMHRGDPALGLRLSAVRRIVPGDRVLWLATDRGVARYQIDTRQMEWWSESNGLRDARVTALQPVDDGLLVGTLRGMMRIDRVGEVSLPAPNLVDPIYALLASRDTVWIGTTRGVAYWTRASAEAMVAPGWRGQVSDRSAVFALGVIGDTVIAMTREVLVRRDPVTGEWIPGVPLTSTVGVLRAMHATPFGLWVGGDRGAAFVTGSGAVLQTLMVGRELPDAVTAITSSDRYLWIGTLRGLVRLALVGR